MCTRRFPQVFEGLPVLCCSHSVACSLMCPCKLIMCIVYAWKHQIISFEWLTAYIYTKSFPMCQCLFKDFFFKGNLGGWPLKSVRTYYSCSSSQVYVLIFVCHFEAVLSGKFCKWGRNFCIVITLRLIWEPVYLSKQAQSKWCVVVARGESEILRGEALTHTAIHFLRGKS